MDVAYALRCKAQSSYGSMQRRRLLRQLHRENTGERAGTEIVQVYTGFPDAAGEPPKRLIGWTHVDLGPGEQRTVTVPVDRGRLTVYDEAGDSWKLTPGSYNVQFGSCRRCRR